MTDEERDRLIIESHQDIKWIKDYIHNLDKFKLMVWGALFVALLGCVL